jgi:hypothetical protein
MQEDAEAGRLRWCRDCARRHPAAKFAVPTLPAALAVAVEEQAKLQQLNWRSASAVSLSQLEL